MTDVTRSLRNQARRTRRRRPPAGRPVPPRQRQVDRAHRDPRRQGPVRLLPSCCTRRPRRPCATIIEESQQAEPGTEARKVGDLYASFMDEERAELLGGDAASPASSSSVDARRLDRRAARRPSAGSSARASPASSSSSSTTTRATPSATSSSSSRAASACPTRATSARSSFAEHPHGVPRAPRADARARAARRRRPTAPRASSTLETDDRRGALGQRRAPATARRPTT